MRAQRELWKSLTAQGMGAALEATAPIPANPAVTLPAVIETLAERFGEGLALADDDQRMSYRDAGGTVAAVFAAGHCGRVSAPGDTVCLMMANCAEYFAIWIGLTRIGVIVALINTNLTGDGLAHAIDCAEPKQIIVGGEFADGLRGDPRRASMRGSKLWVHGTDWEGLQRIDQAVDSETNTAIDDARISAPDARRSRIVHLHVGHHGLPKAAVVSHFRLMQWSYWFAGLMDTRASDRMLNCLPMYHSVGGVVAIGAVLVNGGSVVIRPKFSASRFWDEVAEEDCTLFQYIGELCRYLVNAPVHPRETGHRAAAGCGNGLRGDVWEEFQRRFAIPQILEFYASTEGNVSLYNCEGKPGAIGRIPGLSGSSQ